MPKLQRIGTPPEYTVNFDAVTEANVEGVQIQVNKCQGVVRRDEFVKLLEEFRTPDPDLHYKVASFLVANVIQKHAKVTMENGIKLIHDLAEQLGKHYP